MPTYRKALHAAQKKLEDNGIYPESAQVLIKELAEKINVNLYLDYDQQMPKELYEEYQALTERLAKDEPLGYVLGYTWFYGRKIIVNPDVLIPRPETEELCANVLAAIDEYFPEGDVEMCDIGTGSGEIGITISLEEPRVKMCASDISEDALKTARKNCEVLGANIEYFQGDMCQPFIDAGKQFDFLISDPPYIPAQQTIDSSVKDYEPHVALFGGEDGLMFYRSIFENASKILKPRNIMAFEIGWDQKDALLALAKQHNPNAHIEVLKDMEGKDRMLFVYNL